MAGVVANQYAYFCYVVTVSLMVIGIIPGLALLYYQNTLESAFEDELLNSTNHFQHHSSTSPTPQLLVDGKCECNCNC